MPTVKSGINKVGNNYYQSITTDQPDGSVGTTSIVLMLKEIMVFQFMMLINLQDQLLL